MCQNNKSTAILLESIKNDIDAFIATNHHTENDAVYFMEELCGRIGKTIFSKEDKIEFMAFAASEFYLASKRKWEATLPKTFIQKIRFLFKGK